MHRAITNNEKNQSYFLCCLKIHLHLFIFFFGFFSISLNFVKIPVSNGLIVMAIRYTKSKIDTRLFSIKFIDCIFWSQQLHLCVMMLLYGDQWSQFVRSFFAFSSFFFSQDISDALLMGCLLNGMHAHY